MQTETIPTENEPSLPLEEQIAEAERKHAKLTEAATVANEVAATAQAAFERDPTTKSQADAGVAAQKARNADAAAKAYEETTLEPLRAERQERLKEAEAAQIRAVTDPALIRAELDRMESAVENVVTTFDEAMTALARLLAIRSEHRHGRAGLVGVQINPTDFERVIEELNLKLRAKLPPIHGNRHRSLLSLSLFDNGQILGLQLNRPCRVPRFT